MYCCSSRSPPPAVAQRPPRPAFTELFAYDPTAPSQLLRKWLLSRQLGRKLQPLCVGVVEDSISKTVGRITVLSGANEAIPEAELYLQQRGLAGGGG